MICTALSDTATLSKRSLTHVLRSPDTIITTAFMPVAMMALFVYVFGGAIRTGYENSAATYLGYLLPGILLITVAMGSSYTALRVFTDIDSGITDRFRSMPIARSSILWSHAVASIVATSVSLLAVVTVALVMGFRSQASTVQSLTAVGIVLLFSLALAWVAIIAGLTAKSVEGASAFSYPIIFLPFLSSAFVPTATMPVPVRWFAERQPATALVDCMRNLLLGHPAGTAIWSALAWCSGVLVVAWVSAGVIFHRRTR